MLITCRDSLHHEPRAQEVGSMPSMVNWRRQLEAQIQDWIIKIQQACADPCAVPDGLDSHENCLVTVPCLRADMSSEEVTNKRSESFLSTICCAYGRLRRFATTRICTYSTSNGPSFVSTSISISNQPAPARGHRRLYTNSPQTIRFMSRYSRLPSPLDYHSKHFVDR